MSAITKGIIAGMLLAVLTASPFSAEAQKDEVEAPRHKAGIYATFEQYRMNKPYREGDFILLSVPEIEDYLKRGGTASVFFSRGQYIWLGRFDEMGNFNRVDPDSIWAFVNQEKEFVRHGDRMETLDVVGSICHYSSGASGKKPQEYIFSYEEGDIKPFTRSNLLSIVIQDMELYQEFLQQDSFREMNASMPEYLRRYNERNPIQIPE